MNRPDGLNLYCKVCIREKTAEARARLREYKLAQQQAPAPAEQHPRKPNVISHAAQLAHVRRFEPPDQKVFEAIRIGARTQKEIAHLANLPIDEVGEAIAELLLWRKAIRTVAQGEGPRRYFIKAA